MRSIIVRLITGTRIRKNKQIENNRAIEINKVKTVGIKYLRTIHSPTEHLLN